jgi:hypothetical protein
MENREILFDKTAFFRTMDWFRVIIKFILTRLRLRNKQSCKHCGRDQNVIWIVNDYLWHELPLEYHETSLCIECFIALCGRRINIGDIKILEYLTHQ